MKKLLVFVFVLGLFIFTGLSSMDTKIATGEGKAPQPSSAQQMLLAGEVPVAVSGYSGGDDLSIVRYANNESIQISTDKKGRTTLKRFGRDGAVIEDIPGWMQASAIEEKNRHHEEKERRKHIGCCGLVAVALVAVPPACGIFNLGAEGSRFLFFDQIFSTKALRSLCDSGKTSACVTANVVDKILPWVYVFWTAGVILFFYCHYQMGQKSTK